MNQAKKLLDELPAHNKDFLSYTQIKGRKYFYLTNFEKSTRRRKYLGNSRNPKVIEIKEYHYLDNLIENCKSNIKALQNILNKYVIVSPDEMEKRIPKAYNVNSVLLNKIFGTLDTSEWKANAIKTRNANERYMPDKLQHKANCGEMMRSRGEVIIANILDSLELEYVYELPMMMNGNRKIPDFVVLHPIKKVEIIIEYMGLYNEKEYRESNEKKIAEYFDAGYILGRNLFVFMDDANGSFDSEITNKILKTIFT